MFQKFIERPVLSTVISILLVIVGVTWFNKIALRAVSEYRPPGGIGSGCIPGR
jgi:HAE1 family hydrophobic/amphiphilic exporter-1